MVRWPVCEAEHSLPSARKFKKVCSYTTTLPCDYKSWYFIKNSKILKKVTCNVAGMEMMTTPYRMFVPTAERKMPFLKSNSRWEKNGI
jgi:hypothetical protein